ACKAGPDLLRPEPLNREGYEAGPLGAEITDRDAPDVAQPGAQTIGKQVDRGWLGCRASRLGAGRRRARAEARSTSRSFRRAERPAAARGRRRPMVPNAHR